MKCPTETKTAEGQNVTLHNNHLSIAILIERIENPLDLFCVRCLIFTACRGQCGHEFIKTHFSIPVCIDSGYNFVNGSVCQHSTFASREEQGVHPSCVALLAATLNQIRRAIALSEGPRAADSVRSFGLQQNMFASFISLVCSQSRNKAKIPFNVCSRLVRISLGPHFVCAYDQHTNTLLRCAAVNI